MDELAASIEEVRRRNFRRLLGVSFIFHGIGLLFFMWNPMPRPAFAPAGVVRVRLIAPTPAAQTPAAQPKPSPPVAKKVVLPAQPKKLP